MSSKNKSVRYKGLTRISATFTQIELEYLKKQSEKAGCSATSYINATLANVWAGEGFEAMANRVNPQIISGTKKGVGGGNKRKPIKKVTQRKKGVNVIVQGKKEEIGQIELDV